MGGKQHVPFFRSFEARAYLCLGRVEDRENCLDLAKQCIAETNQRFYEPGVCIESAAVDRDQGKCTEADLMKAISTAQGIPPELRGPASTLGIAATMQHQLKRGSAVIG